MFDVSDGCQSLEIGTGVLLGVNQKNIRKMSTNRKKSDDINIRNEEEGR